MIRSYRLPQELRELLREEYRESARAARAFAHVCQFGDYEDLRVAAQWLGDTAQGWHLAMREVSKLDRVSPEIQDAFIGIWTEHKHIPLRVGDTTLLAKALRLLFLRNYTGPEITLYRGEHYKRSRRIHGFSWTSSLDVARRFAQQNGVLEGGIVLQATLKSDAIQHLRQAEIGYYEEDEFIVDPYKVGRAKILEHIAPRAVLPMPTFVGIHITG